MLRRMIKLLVVPFTVLTTTLVDSKCMVLTTTSIFSLLPFLPTLEGASITESCTEENSGECKQQQETKPDENVFDVFGKWVDDRMVEGSKFLEENILNPKKEGLKDAKQGQSFENDKKTEEETSSSFGLDGLMKMWNSLTSEEDSQGAVNDLIEHVRAVSNAKDSKESKSFMDIMTIFTNSLSEVNDAMDRHFSQLDMSKINPVSLFYYLEREDERKNPSYKRMIHRPFRGIAERELFELHEALYLSDLAYTDSADEIKNGLNTTAGATWELIYCKIDSAPGDPAHFLALKKQQPSSSSWLWDDDSLEVLLVVRGTKQFADVLSDALLDAVDFRGGKAHAGIVAAGKQLVERHQELIRSLLKMSKKKKIKLRLIGHSLGAGAASIAAMEWNDQKDIEASVVGFGCPALVSKDLSESSKKYITTIVSDSDVVPRMSGATVMNAHLDVMAYDWTDKALRDVEQLLTIIKDNSPFKIKQDDLDYVLNFVNETLVESIQPAVSKVPTERLEPVLIPPGECVHFYRDGYSVSGSYTPCDFFREVDVTRTMIDDHLTGPGYHRLFLELMRTVRDDDHFSFDHKYMATG